MDVNFATIARASTATSLELPTILCRVARKTQTFCTALVGPPPHVQNFWRPNALATKNLHSHDASAHQKPLVQNSKIHERHTLLHQGTRSERAKLEG